MKKTVSILISSALMLSMVTGCASGTESAEHTNTKYTAESGTPSLQDLTLPERFTGDWEEKDAGINVYADAEICLPDQSSLPTATVTRRNFTQADVDLLLSTFLKGATLYEETVMDRQMATERLEAFRAMERGELPLSGDATEEKLPEIIKYYEEYIRTAPEKGERLEASTKLHASDYAEELVTGCAEVDGKNMHFVVRNWAASHDEALVYVDGYGDQMNCNAWPVDELAAAGLKNLPISSMTEDDAVAIGDSLMQELGMSTMSCDDITAVVYGDVDSDERFEAVDTGYVLEYVRTVEGVPVAHTPFDGYATEENSAQTRVWPYERITVSVTEDGVVYFRWSSPCNEPVIQNPNVQLLDFDDVADIFGKMIIVKNSDWENINKTNGFDTINDLNVDRVKLTLMRIRDKDNLDAGTIVPVWDFWGTTTAHAADQAHRNKVDETEYYTVLLTINAIDGTIVDRELGY